jgi:hypothetical protein
VERFSSMAYDDNLFHSSPHLAISGGNPVLHSVHHTTRFDGGMYDLTRSLMARFSNTKLPDTIS